MKAFFRYNLGSKEVMEEIVNFISSTYEDQNGGPDLEDLLGGLDISLN